MPKHKKLSDLEKGTYCLNCLWWWDLNGTGICRCYNAKSSRYHKATKTFEGCGVYESLFRHRIDCQLGVYEEGKKG